MEVQYSLKSRKYAKKIVSRSTNENECIFFQISVIHQEKDGAIKIVTKNEKK